MKKAFLAGLAVTFVLSSFAPAMSYELNMDVPYGDREPGGYQHLTTHYHNYWRRHHHPWSNIERERHVVREAQDLANLTKVWEGNPRRRFVTASDNTVRDRFNKYVWNTQKTDFNAELPSFFVEQVKSRPSVDGMTREALRLNEFLPKPLTYNDITYMPDEFTREKLDLPDQRYRAGLVGNDMILYDVVTGRVRGIWRDIIE